MIATTQQKKKQSAKSLATKGYPVKKRSEQTGNKGRRRKKKI
jgi:hypothetical protein